MVPPRKIGRRGWSCRDVSPLCVTNIRRMRSLPARRRVSAAGARFLNEGPVWGAASGNRNSEDGREAAGRREVAGSGMAALEACSSRAAVRLTNPSCAVRLQRFGRTALTRCGTTIRRRNTRATPCSRRRHCRSPFSKICIIRDRLSAAERTQRLRQLRPSEAHLRRPRLATRMQDKVHSLA
jgi:hypothetical protein